MALTLTVEDGTGLANANTYVSLAEAESYFEARLHSSDWTTADEATKKASLVQATRLLDQNWKWYGYKANTTQALQWPRVGVTDPDLPNTEVEDDIVPVAIKNAVYEFAIALIPEDRLADPEGEGIGEFELFEVFTAKFDASTQRPVFPQQIAAELLKYGTMRGSRASTVKAIRQ